MSMDELYEKLDVKLQHLSSIYFTSKNQDGEKKKKSTFRKSRAKTFKKSRAKTSRKR
jgi:hypothetical protein